MIGKLTGEYGGTISEGVVLIDVGGVGYAVRVPQGSLIVLQHTPRISLFIHTAVREDAIDLYGFPTAEELGVFRKLCGVSGIGPKTALGILNLTDIGTLTRAIARGDASALTKVFGIGKKSAERIVVELRDKMDIQTMGDLSTTSPDLHDDTQVLEALMALGYSAAESRAAVKAIDPDTQEMRARLSEALRRLGTRTPV